MVVFINTLIILGTNISSNYIFLAYRANLCCKQLLGNILRMHYGISDLRKLTVTRICVKSHNERLCHTPGSIFLCLRIVPCFIPLPTLKFSFADGPSKQNVIILPLPGFNNFSGLCLPFSRISSLLLKLHFQTSK